MTKFALLSYTTNNLGDEIQSIAARQFLPRADLLVDRDDWTRYPPGSDGEFKIILNGWFTHDPGKWPPPGFLRPLLISMHISRERHRRTALVPPSQALLEGENLAYLKRHEPIGGRDLSTVSLLTEHGVRSYFSGCLTLTLGAGDRRARKDYICAVDLPEQLYQALAARVRSPILRLSHRDPHGGTFEERCTKAGRLLGLYAHAKCVVTTRLHCAMPCIGFGTPTLFINHAPDQYRLSGLLDLVRNCSAEDFARDAARFDFDRPTANGFAHVPLRENLKARLEYFTGSPFRPFQPAPEDTAGG